MADILEYKCPCCGGKIEFDSSIQKMKCPYCDSEFDMEAVKAYDESLNSQETPAEASWDTSGEQWDGDETGDMAVYVCKSCGGEIVGDKNMGATRCPFCDNPVVIMGKFAGDLKPDLIIPFKIKKDGVKQALMAHLQKKTLLPSVFKDQNHIDEIMGVYVPFWLFDADAQATVRFKATKVKEWTVAKVHFKETSYFSVTRSGGLSFDRIPVDGSSKMPDDLMESIEPYDSAGAVDFQTAYFAGYLADRYDVPMQECVGRANERIRSSIIEEFRKDATGYDSIDLDGDRISLENTKSHYALYPVWLLHTSWNDKKYTFAMNGQTGKFVGDLPMDKGKLVLHVILTVLITAAVVLGVGKFIFDELWALPAVFLAAVIAIVRATTLISQLKSVGKQDAASSYLRNGSLNITDRQDVFLYKKTDRTVEDD